MTTISTKNLRDAFQVNDLEVRPPGGFRDILDELEVEDLDGLMELLIERVDRNELRTEMQDSIALYLDGIAAGLRARRLADISAET